MPSTTTTNLDLFLLKLKSEHEYATFGEQISLYELKRQESSRYAIHRINPNFGIDQNFVEWYSRLQTFLVFFIDAASTIDTDDPNWMIYLLYQQYRNIDGQICYAPIGFITVYLYYAYPNKKRPRIRFEIVFVYVVFKGFSFSQMLILPPYRKKCHYRRFLTAIYKDLRNDPLVEDITGIY